MELFSQFNKVRDIDLITEFATQIAGQRVLEIGCGGGERTTILVKAGCLVTATDITDNRKDGLSSGYDFFIADGRNLPFKDESFDVVFSTDVIEHIDNDILFLSESYRVCKRRGRSLIGTPNRNRLSNKLRQFIGRKVSYPLKLAEDCIHLREYTMLELNKMAKDVGFTIEKERYLWLGLLGIFGFKHFPFFLRHYVQYLVLFVMKP